MQLTRSKISIAYMVIIICLLAFVSVSSFIASLNMESQSDALAEDALPITNAANNLLTDLINQETGIRGFMVTGSESFLEPYEEGKAQLNKDLAMLRTFESQYPDLRLLLESEALPTINNLQEYFANQISLIHGFNINEARNRSLTGKELMDQYRGVHNKIIANVQALTDHAHLATQKAGTISRAITLTGGVAAVLVCILSGIIFARANRVEKELRKSEETYRFMAESLESQNEEILAQQEQQEITLNKLSSREQELKLINDQLLIEKKLIEDQRDLIEGILEASHEGMMMCDGQGQVLFSNQRLSRYFHLNGQSGRNLVAVSEEIAASESGFQQVSSSIKALIAGSLEQISQRFSFDLDGQLQHAELYAAIVGEGTEQKGYLFVFRDRTEEERVDEMKNEFISIVSHELRTPLSSVLGFIEILLNRDLPADKQNKYMETIHKEAVRLSDLIDDFLDLQRMESGRQLYHFHPMNLVSAVQEVLEQWQGKQNHRITLHHSKPEIWIQGDTDRISQVVHNLVSNAIKYSPGADNVDVWLDIQGNQVKLSVQDYGLGIPKDAKTGLFSKFFRVDNSDRRQIGGTGLGLSIVKEIVEAHNGQIAFTSEMGKGTTFTVTWDAYTTGG